jgi:hypothetical protein
VNLFHPPKTAHVPWGARPDEKGSVITLDRETAALNVFPAIADSTYLDPPGSRMSI